MESTPIAAGENFCLLIRHEGDAPECGWLWIRGRSLVVTQLDPFPPTPPTSSTNVLYHAFTTTHQVSHRALEPDEEAACRGRYKNNLSLLDGCKKDEAYFQKNLTPDFFKRLTTLPIWEGFEHVFDTNQVLCVVEPISSDRMTPRSPTRPSTASSLLRSPSRASTASPSPRPSSHGRVQRVAQALKFVPDDSRQSTSTEMTRSSSSDQPMSPALEYALSTLIGDAPPRDCTPFDIPLHVQSAASSTEHVRPRIVRPLPRAHATGYGQRQQKGDPVFNMLIVGATVVALTAIVFRAMEFFSEEA